MKSVVSRHGGTATVEILDEMGNDFGAFNAELAQLQSRMGRDEIASRQERWLDAPGHLRVQVASVAPDSTNVASLLGAARDVVTVVDAIEDRSPEVLPARAHYRSGNRRSL